LDSPSITARLIGRRAWLSIVFFSYSHKDEDLRDRLEAHLAVLISDGTISTWHDRRIKAGEVLGERIDENLELADIILLLVSADFLSSDYCYSIEMKRALERRKAGEAQVIAVILRPCDWQSSPLGDLLAVPKDGKPIVSWPDKDEGFLDVVKQLRRILPSQNAPQPPQTPNVRTPLRAAISADPDREMHPTIVAQTSGQQGPRSSNLRLKKSFSDADLDQFLEDAFAYISSFFQNSLTEIADRNKGIQTKFKQIDATRFTAAIYRDGSAISRCKIILGGFSGKSITFSYNDSLDENSTNEELRVKFDDQAMYLKTLGQAHFGAQRTDSLSFEGASEYYWAMFVRPLQ
jgi:hypothetical protein